MIMGFGPVWRPKAAEEFWRVVALSAELSFVSQFQPRNENLIRRERLSESDMASKPKPLSSNKLAAKALLAKALPAKTLSAKTVPAKILSMPRSLSLKNRESIRKLFRNAKRRSGSSLTVFYRISPFAGSDEDQPAKWLVAIPKRTGNAVRRNKLRRALRETIRLWENRAKVAGEIAVRYNPPRLTPQSGSVKNGSVKKGSAKRTPAKLDKKELQVLRTELIGLLEDVYSRVKN